MLSGYIALDAPENPPKKKKKSKSFYLVLEEVKNLP